MAALMRFGDCHPVDICNFEFFWLIRSTFELQDLCAAPRPAAYLNTVFKTANFNTVQYLT